MFKSFQKEDQKMRKRIMVMLGAAMLAGWAAEALAQPTYNWTRMWYYEGLVPPDIDGWRNPFEYAVTHIPARKLEDGFGDMAAGDFGPPKNAGLQGDGTMRFVDTGVHGYDGFSTWASERGNFYLRVKVNSGPTGTLGAYTLGVHSNDPDRYMAIALDTDGIRLVGVSGTLVSSGTIDMTTWRIIRIQQDNRDTVHGGVSNVGYVRIFVDNVKDSDTPVINWYQMHSYSLTPLSSEAVNHNWGGFYYIMGSNANVTDCDIVVDWMRQTYNSDQLTADPTYHPHGLIPASTNKLWIKRTDWRVYPHYVNMATAQAGGAATPASFSYQVINTSYNNPNTVPYTVIECDSNGNATDYGWITLDKSGGTLAANQGALDNVTVTLNENVSGLAAGTYEAYIKFTPSYTMPAVVPGITVDRTCCLATDENGSTTQFTVVLDTQPTADVVIPVASANTNEGTVDKASLTFTSSDWNIPQTVTVTGVDDATSGDRTWYYVTLGPATSTDTDYNGMDPEDVYIVNNDNDAYGNWTVTVNPQYIITDESGSTAQFSVVLTRPVASGGSVTLKLGANTSTYPNVTTTFDDSEWQLSASQLVFTSANWNVPQTVTVTGLNDAWDDPDLALVINTANTIQSGDANWQNRRADEVIAINRNTTPTIRKIKLVVKDPEDYVVFEYCGDVPPTQNDSAGPGLRFRQWGLLNDGTTRTSDPEMNNFVNDDQLVTPADLDPENAAAASGAWNKRALYVQGWRVIDTDRSVYLSDKNTGAGADQDGWPAINPVVGATVVARLMCLTPGDNTYSAARMLGVQISGGTNEWPVPKGSNAAEVWASITYSGAAPSVPVILDGFRRNSGYLEADQIVARTSPTSPDGYHIIRLALVPGLNDTSQDRMFRGDGSASGYKTNAYGRVIRIWCDEDLGNTAPVVDIANNVAANFGSSTYAFYKGFQFGVQEKMDHEVFFDWVTFTNAGAFGPGEEDAVIGRSLIPTSTRCQPCNTEYWADVDRDDDVDQDDFAQFQACYSGSGNDYPLEPMICGCFDRDGNGEIDMDDFDAFAACATGPGIAGPPEGCTP